MRGFRGLEVAEILGMGENHPMGELREERKDGNMGTVEILMLA